MRLRMGSGRWVIALAVVGGIGLAVFHGVRSTTSRPEGPDESKPTASESAAVDANATVLGEGPLLAGALGCNQPAPPPISWGMGPPSDANTPDLSSPAMAVYSVLSLIDRGATDALPQCFVEKSEGPPSDLYPRYVGPPVGLVDVIEDEESAEVVWEATVHTAFSRDGKDASPGELVTLTTHLVRIDGVWRLDGLCE